MGREVSAEGLSRMAAGAGRHLLRRALADHLAASVTALGPKVDDPVRCTDNIQVVLDDHQRMSGIEQRLERAEQGADILKMQTGGGLIEEKKRAPRGGARSGLGEMARQLESLRLTAA